MSEETFKGYIGTNTGICYVEVTPEGEIHVLNTTPAVHSGYMAITEDKKYLYTCVEVTYYEGKALAAASAFRIEEDGHLTWLNTEPVSGQMNNFVYVDEERKKLYSSSYMAGSVSINPILPDGSIGPVEYVIRHQKVAGKHSPSMHSVYLTPDKRYLMALDVGLDTVDLYDPDSGNYECVCEVHADGRPRQAAFSADGKFIYISTESGGEVFVYAYEPDAPVKLRKLQRIRTTPEWFNGPHAETSGIKLSPNGELLYVTNRCPDINDLGGFSVDKETGLLTTAPRVEIDGVFPWDMDFTPDGKYMLCGLRFSNDIQLFEVDYAGKRLVPKNKIDLPACSCIKMLR